MWAIRRPALLYSSPAAHRFTTSNAPKPPRRELTRRFSSDGDRHWRGGSGRGGSGRGSGRGEGSRGGPRTNYKSRSQEEDGRRPKMQNFYEKFLEPAARGELKKHQSGIPRLAGRRPKSHGVRSADVIPEDEELYPEFDDFAPIEFTSTNEPKKPSKTGMILENSLPGDLSLEEHKKLMDFITSYHELVRSEDPEEYYWKESDYDDSGVAKKIEILENLKEQAAPDSDGNLVVEVDDETFAMFEEVKQDDTDNKDSSETRTQRGPPALSDDPAFLFVMESMGIKGADKPPPPDYDRVTPLQLQGPTMSDFVLSMMNHPTKYAEVRYKARHQESARIPLADFPPNRGNPSSEFVESHIRFLYVWGLPAFTLDGQPTDMENPLHCFEIQKVVGDLFDVPLHSVSVAGPSSAFVGFKSREDHRFAVVVGPKTKIIESPVRISKYDAPKHFSLAKDGPHSLLLLENLPSGWTPYLLSSSLFPDGTDVGSIYGKNLCPGQIAMISPNSAVVVMNSEEVADSALQSSMVEERLVEIGRHRLRYSKARRELVFTGTHGGPDGTERLRKLGPRLIVDGDMPTKKFFLSHAGALFLRNLDPSITKQDITDFFQPFCVIPRDMEGSVEFVTCREGSPTGRAYVGFDELGEAQEAFKAVTRSGGRIYGLGPNVVVARLVKEADKSIRREKRPTRSEKDLLGSLNDWEQFVDPEELQELLDHGISKEALDEALRAIRYHNPTFSSLDQSMRSETINPEKDAGGMYEELVQTYISTLKECLSTPDNPGPIYESLFIPGEEIDTEIFDREPERQEALRKRREYRDP